MLVFETSQHSRRDEKRKRHHVVQPAMTRHLTIVGMFQTVLRSGIAVSLPPRNDRSFWRLPFAQKYDQERRAASISLHGRKPPELRRHRIGE